MSVLLEERAALIGALELAGVRTATTGKLAAPCVLVEPGDPWTEPRRSTVRVGRWRLTAVASKADQLAAYAELADLVDRVDVALRTLEGAQLPTWARPAEAEVAGVRHAFATLATVQYASR